MSDNQNYFYMHFIFFSLLYFSSVMVDHPCCDAANLGERGLELYHVLSIKHRYELFPDKSYSSMHVIENSIAAS